MWDVCRGGLGKGRLERLVVPPNGQVASGCSLHALGGDGWRGADVGVSVGGDVGVSRRRFLGRSGIRKVQV
jgi:hypothetical protein